MRKKLAIVEKQGAARNPKETVVGMAREKKDGKVMPKKMKVIQEKVELPLHFDLLFLARRRWLVST